MKSDRRSACQGAARASRSLAVLMLVCVLGTGMVWAQPTEPFTAAGNMTTARSWHTATLLRDGKVLIVGGSRDRPASAEIYDPAAGTFTTTGDMTTIRRGPTATLLRDGRVLIAGGDRFTGNAPLKSSAEVYDPSTGKFTPTADMVTVQIGGTATLLNNGKVLIAGGLTSVCCPASVVNPELYDPSTGTFSLTGTFKGTGDGLYVTGGPYVSAATLLPDGRFLIAGEPTSELYDPVTGTFSLTGAMTTPCVLGGHPTYIGGRTATLLTNGKVLVAGGAHEDCGRFADAELYDPATGTFTATGNMTRVRDNHTATLLHDGAVLIAGGESYDCGARSCIFGTAASAEFYDPSTGTFAAVGDMTDRRAAHTATLLKNGSVLITGGYFFGGIGIYSCCFASAERYNPLAAPVPGFPLDGVVTENLRPRLQVHNAAATRAVGKVTYRFEWSDRSDFEPSSHTRFKDNVPEGGGGDTAFSIGDDLTPNTLYYWRSRATVEPLVGQTDVAVGSEYSDLRSFKTPNIGVISENKVTLMVPASAATVAASNAVVSAPTIDPGVAARPSGLVATASGSGVVLTWIGPSGVTPLRYAISGGDAPHLSTLPVVVTPDASTRYTIPALPPGHYYFTVSAILVAGLSPPSDETDVVASGSTLATGPPTGALAVSDARTFTVTWTRGQEGATVYYVEIGSTPGRADVATLTTTQPGITFRADAATYYLRVRAAGGATVSQPSNEVSVSVAPAICAAAPLDPVLLPVSTTNDETTISWLPAGGPRADHYRVDGTGPSGPTTMISRGTGTSLTAGLKPGIYAIRVTAINACGASEASNQITFTQPNLVTGPARH